MSQLCNHCNCVGIQNYRCHEQGCPNERERIFLVDDGTLDTVFRCAACGEEMRYNFDPMNDHAEDCEVTDGSCNCYDNFTYNMLRETADEHVCENEEN